MNAPNRNTAEDRATAREVAASTGVHWHDIEATWGGTVVRVARREVIRVLFDDHNWSWRRIGRALDRDHETIRRTYQLDARRRAGE